jgi:hypothetical protein
LGFRYSFSGILWLIEALASAAAIGDKI